MQPHRAFLGLAVLVPFLALPALTIAAPLPGLPGQPTDEMPLTPPVKPKAQEQATTPVAPPSAAPKPMRAGATRGVTDGEPATAEAHCCGMKGLGGAKVDVMCHPGTVAMGQPFTVNVNFTSDVKRPVDVHVDVLNAQTKTYYAGKWEEFDTQAGMASLTIKMPETGVTEPFLWKVFVTPRGEPFPNMLAETGFVSHLADSVQNDCESFESYGFDPPEMKDNAKTIDFVALQKVPNEITPGSRATIEVEYNLVGAKEATISASLMCKGPNTMISSTANVAAPGQNKIKMTIPVPADAPKEAVYIVVTLTPEGATWENRLAEDRTYRVKMAGAARMRRE